MGDGSHLSKIGFCLFIFHGRNPSRPPFAKGRYILPSFITIARISGREGEAPRALLAEGAT